MPIELRTGLPGSGKSLFAVARLMELQLKHPERPRFVIGITDLRDDLATVITEDQLKNWETFPAGSIIFVDECQKYMPARRSGDAPKWIRDLSTHRHLGLDFVLITQHPALIDSHVRRLVDHHLHNVRKYGTSLVDQWSFPECVAEPTNKTTQKGASGRTVSKFPIKAFDAYTSAELHTVQRRIPRFIVVGAVLLVAVPVVVFLAIHVMRRIGASEHPEAVSTASVATQGAVTGKGSGEGRAKPREVPMSRDEWVARFEPRVAGMPWSAPAYDDRPVEGTPELYCVIFAVGEPDERCRCNTEQGTRAMVPMDMCKQMARDGTYNPYRKPRSDQLARPVEREPASDPAPVEVASASQPRISHTSQPGRSASTAVAAN